MNSVYTVETARVYRAGGRRFFSRSAAIRRYARERFFRKHGCDCEQPDYSDGYPGYTCPVHDAWERVRPRYLRVIRKALRTKATDAEPQRVAVAVDPAAEAHPNGLRA